MAERSPGANVITSTIPVVVIDDMLDLTTLMTQVLGDIGYTVESFSHAVEGLDHAISLPRCVVILDLLMPVMDGWQFLEQLRAIRGPDTHPVIVLTAARGAQMKPLTSPVQALLKKPVAMDPFLETLDSVWTSLARGA
jgi:CheY-like chemotaxis protein